MIEFATFDERPDLAQRYASEAQDIWPPYMQFVYHDEVCEAFWPRLGLEFPAFQIIVYDEAHGQLLAQGNCVPIASSGRDEDLADGVPTVLEQAFRGAAQGRRPDSLCALLIGIQPHVRSKGLSSEVLGFMKQLARRHGLRSLVAPVRPNLKEQYPLTPIERYVRWRRADSLPLDPWLRTHERVGGRFAGIAPRGNVFRGTVAEWERWTGLALPDSSEYVVRGALSPLTIDRERDQGILIEPNVWMVHQL